MSTSRRAKFLRAGMMLTLLAGITWMQACDDDPWGPAEIRIGSLTLGSPTAPPPRIEPGDTYQMIATAFDRDGNRFIP